MKTNLDKAIEYVQESYVEDSKDEEFNKAKEMDKLLDSLFKEVVGEIDYNILYNLKNKKDVG